MRMTGDAARALQAVFVVDWANATGERLLTLDYFPASPGGPDQLERTGLPVQLCLSGPDSQWRAVRQQYFAMIVGARERVWAQSPFFILDDTTAEALKAAALAGVDVRIMISARGMNQKLPYWAANTYMAEVAEAGVQVFLYEPGYLHAKTISVDGKVSSIGSANWDIRSFSINYELNALIYDHEIAAELESAFARDLARCRRFDPAAYRARSLPVRFRDSVARLASPLL
jgi:cardiolipin synthase